VRILFLDLDTLRPDHLGCYGYSRATSPNLDRIAAEGVRFDNYYCTDAPCLPSRAALMTGQFGIHSGVVNHGGVAADLRLVGARRGFRDRIASDGLAALLRQAGLRTCSISPFSERHAAWWFHGTFNEVHNTGRGGMESAEEITPTALRWIRDHAREENWFLHVNYWDPHTPYRAPADFGNPFAGSPLPAWITPDVLARHVAAVGPHTAQEIAMWDERTDPRYPRQPGAVRTMADLRRHFDGYDCGIAYMDQHIGRLLNALADASALDDLAIVVSSDHGENQGELGIYAEHATADHATCRIPMIVRWPGGARGHVDRGLHGNIDIAPTLAELLGRPAKPSWDGQSYAAAVRSGQECGREQLVVSQCAHVCQRSVRWGDWLYMRTYHDGFHLFPREMLFDLAADPYEQHDLAADRPDLCHEAAHRLLDWHDRMMATMPDGGTVDPMVTVMAEGGPLHARGKLEEYCERLKTTGREWAVTPLRERHPREFAG
jgi:arylsulfatase A-like enzyme